MALTTSTTSTHDQVEGKLKEAAGKIKEGFGRLTNDPVTEQDGFNEKVDGKVQKKVGDVKQVFEK